MMSIYRNYYCDRCELCDGCDCFADYGDGYMINPETEEIIDDAAPLIDERGNEFTMCERAVGYIANQCEDDGNYHVENVYTEDTYCYYSWDYAYSFLYRCEDCGCWFEYSDSLRLIDDSYYCSDCAKDHSLILGWHDHKGDFETIATDEDTPETRRKTIGFELECDGYGLDKTETAYTLDGIFNNRRDVLVFEDDCSLDCGFEIISQPHTASALEKLDIEEIVSTLSAHGADYAPSTAGFHMHFDRNWIGDTWEEQKTTLARLYLAYDFNWYELVELSQRDDADHIASMARRPIIETFNADDIITDNYTRYCAINNNNVETIEFRLGAGVLDAQFLRKWIALHIDMIEACRAGKSFIINSDYTITINEYAEEVIKAA